jgi:NADH:ubiquinone oxidoreductase subunit 3 (subunit A)
MAAGLILSPPAVFVVILITVSGLSYVLSGLALKPKKIPDGLTEPYACGEDIPTHMIQPDYSQFFPFAFYFTILHVVALVVVLVPAVTIETFIMAIIYIFCAIIGLTVLYRR